MSLVFSGRSGINVKPPVLLKWFALPLLAVSVGGCAIHGEPAKLSMTVPETWSEAGAAAPQPSSEWWNEFASAELAQLITTALAENPDMSVASERVLQAEAAVRSVGASLFPFVDVGASSGRRRSAQDGGDYDTSDTSGVSLGVSYEVDLWGRVRAGKRAALAQLDGSRY